MCVNHNNNLLFVLLVANHYILVAFIVDFDYYFNRIGNGEFLNSLNYFFFFYFLIRRVLNSKFNCLFYIVTKPERRFFFLLKKWYYGKFGYLAVHLHAITILESWLCFRWFSYKIVNSILVRVKLGATSQQLSMIYYTKSKYLLNILLFSKLKRENQGFSRI